MFQYVAQSGLELNLTDMSGSLPASIKDYLGHDLSGRAVNLPEVLSIIPEIERLYATPAGVWEKGKALTILEHTEGVLQAFSRYPLLAAFFNPETGLGRLMRPQAFALILAFHDLGKHLPDGYLGNLPTGKEKEKQHARTTVLFDKYKEQLGLSEHEVAIGSFLINGDRFGSFFRGIFKGSRLATETSELTSQHVDSSGKPLAIKKEVEALFRSGQLPHADYTSMVQNWQDYVSLFEMPAAGAEQVARALALEFARGAAELKVDPVALLTLQTLYFQCDVRAYTADAKEGTPSLDYLLKRNSQASSFKDPQFIFDPAKGRFIFSERYESVYRILEDAVRMNKEKGEKGSI